MKTLKQNEMAIRIYGPEFDGLINKEVKVEEGTVALLFEDKKYEGSLVPGKHKLGTDGFWGTLGLGKGKRYVIVAKSSESIIELSVPRLFTSDPLSFQIDCRFSVKPKPGGEIPFAVNLMANRNRLTVEDAKTVLYDEVRDAIQAWATNKSVEELATDLELKKQLSFELEAQLERTFHRYGLSFSGVETGNFHCPEWKGITEGRAEVFLQVSREEAEVEGKKLLFDVYNKSELQELAEETEKVALYEKKSQVWARIRRASNSEEMDKIGSEKELEDFIRSIDRDKLIKDTEFDEFGKDLRFTSGDNERNRAHLAILAEVHRKYEVKRAELAGDRSLTQQKVEAEIGLERLRFEWKIETELQKADLEVEKRRRQAELELELDDLEVTQEIRQEVERKQAQLDAKAEEQKQDIERRQAELDLKLEELKERHRLEMEKAETFDGLSIQALVSVSDPDKAPLLAEMARTETMKNLSPEQILAIAAQNSPELGKSVAELASGARSAEQKDFSERLMAEQKDSSTQMRETYQEFSQTTKEMFEKALDTQAQVSSSFAQGMGNSVSSGIPGTGSIGAGGRVIVCRKCQVQSSVGTKFCAN
ncbi:MAG: hypothetical protein GY852_11215, partial [bacterium]|nr:hypothetical protein [bacterium]